MMFYYKKDSSYINSRSCQNMHDLDACPTYIDYNNIKKNKFTLNSISQIKLWYVWCVSFKQSIS